LADRDKATGIETAELLARMGFSLVATEGTAAALRDAGIEVDRVLAKLADPVTPGAIHSVTLIEQGGIDLVINSPQGRGSRADGSEIRDAAGRAGVPLVTTAAAGLAAAHGISDWANNPLTVRSLQEIHRSIELSQLSLALDDNAQDGHSDSDG
jgi:carbamoyl-phosphate synthase large subunit